MIEVKAPKEDILEEVNKKLKADGTKSAFFRIIKYESTTK